MTAERAPRHTSEASMQGDWRDEFKRDSLDNGLGVNQVEANARLGTGEVPILTPKMQRAEQTRRRKRRSGPSEEQRKASELRYPPHKRAQPLPLVHVVPVEQAHKPIEEAPAQLVQGELDIDWE